MASVKITSILGSNIIGGSRITINNNFLLLQDSINSMLSYLDINSQTLTGLKSIVLSTNPGVATGTNSSITTLETNGSIKVDGNAIIGSQITAQTISLTNGTGITVNTGNIQLLDSTGKIKSSGNLEIAGQTVYGSYSTTFAAYNRLSYISGTTTNINTTDPTNPIGYISMTNKRALVLDFTGYTGVGDLDVKKFQLLTTDAIIGQEITLIILHADDASTSYNITLIPTNIAYTITYPISTGIVISKSYSVLHFVFGGLTTGWILTGTHGNGITIS